MTKAGRATGLSGRKSIRRRRSALLLSGGVIALATANPALGQAVDALPTGGTVVAGSVTIGSPSPAAKLDITQSSNRAVINWSSFDIGQDAEVAFSQPNSSAIALNRVTGGSAPSQIAGKLTANGIVAVLNANGVVFAGTADVDVGGLVASTGQIDTAAFMAGGNLIGITGANAGEIVVSAGADITVASAGLAAFVAPSVRNSGTITATAGRVQLGAGTAFTLDLASDGLLEIGIGADNALVRNLGSVFASGGQIQLSARQAGALVAQTIRTGVLPVGSARLDGATIVLDATGSDVQLTSNLVGNGNLTLTGRRIYGAGDIEVDGNLTLNVDAGGLTVGNWIADALGVIGIAVDASALHLGNGTYNLGTSRLVLDKSISLVGQSQAGTIIDGRSVTGGYTMLVAADNTTLSQFTLLGSTVGSNYGIKVQPNPAGYNVNQRLLNFAISDVTVRGSARAELDLNGVVGATITNFTADGRSYVGSAATAGAGVQITDSANVTLTGVHALGNTWGSVALYQANKSGAYNGQTTNININASQNVFEDSLGLFTQLESATQGFGQLNLTGFNYAVRNLDHRPGDNLENQFTFYRTGISDATNFALTVGTASSSSIEGYTGTALTNVFTVSSGLSINSALRDARSGGSINVGAGTYNLGTSALVLNKSIALIGESQAGVIIDGRAVNNSEGRGTISVLADNVSLANFTLYGSEVSGGNFGIKVQPTNIGHTNTPGGDHRQVTNFAISDVTVRGSRRAELDLNGVVGATITNFTADGRTVAGPNSATAGSGIQITDSANVTLTGVHTLGNTWGAVALYQTNSPSGFDIQTNNITISAAANQFEESIGLFSQLESTTQGFGQLNLTGFNYAVRNTDHRPDNLDGQFIFYRTSLNDAVAFAKSVGTASVSSIEGYTGTGFSNAFTVVDGLSVNAAIRDVRNGGTVNVGAGTFAETVSIGKSITLDGAGINATSITGGMLLSGSLSNLALSDFAVSGSGGTNVIGNGGTITGLTMNGVRVDGLGVAGRHGFSGGQIGGAISITNSEFVNIRNWAAFDTRSGAGTDQGSQITSAVFSNNLIENTAGHIAFRQDQSGSWPNVTFANNTVRNIGNATNSFGAIFKAFNANTVNFTGNSVSGVGTSGFNPSGEASYGAVLMVRGPGPLNLTGNIFTNNNQVFAVEPGRALPTTVNFTGNTFTNNAYSIYLPGNLSGSGTITFGAGNNFVAGPSTVRHIVWRSASGLDLSGVSFDGTLAANLGLAQAFAVEDLITDGIDLSGLGLARLANGQLFVTTNSGTNAAQRAVALGTDGDTLHLAAGTHTLSETLFLTKDIDVLGQGKGVTILNASGHGTYGIRVHADNVALAGFTLNGSAAATNSSYGIKVEAGAAPDRNTGFSITNVAIAGSRKNGLDLNTVVGALIDGVTVTGVIAGNGISISDSANVTIRNSTTSGNAWGGLGLYQTNNLGAGGSDQQLTGITVEASNAFAEPAGVYLQASSTLTVPGTISVLGYGYTVRNPAHRSDGAQFTFFQKTAQAAYDYAVSLASPGAGVVQGWTGSANDRNFYVGSGALVGGGQQALSLQTAFGASVNGDTINVASGTYAENAVLSGTRTLNFGTVVLNGLSLTSATAGNNLRGNLTLATGNFSAAGPLSLTGATGIAATGDILLGAVNGAHALTLTGKALTLGASNLANLTATGTGIVTHDVTTTGTQSYTGPLTLNGNYVAAAFTAGGSSTLGSATSITATGDIGLGPIGGAQALTLQGAAISLGAADIASLGVTGATIATNGVVTSGSQSYNGTTTFAGDYQASEFAVEGAAVLADDTSISATTDIALGTVSGEYALSLTSEAVALDTANLVSLTVTGNTILTAGATTTGAQSYTGETVLSGAYQASEFTIAGAALLAGDTAVMVEGAATFGAVDGSHDLELTGDSVALGALGQDSLLGAVSVTADEAVLLAGSYSAESLAFAGGANATVRVTQAETSFDTSSAGGSIEIAPQLIGTENGAQSVTFVTGAGAADDGDIMLGNVGSSAVRVGDLSVTGGDFSAATVKLAGDFTSVLGGSQVFSSQTLDTLGNVNAQVAGSESGPIVAGGAVSVTAGGSGTGSIIAGGPVQLAYSEEVSREISSQGSVSLSAAGPVTGSITATGPVGVSSTGEVSAAVSTSGNASISATGGVSSAVTAGGGVSLTSSQGAVSSAVNSGGTVSVNATGPVTGSITATGAVAVTATGLVSTEVRTSNSANISSVSGVSSTIVAGQGVQVASSQGQVSGSISAGGAVNVNAAGPVSTAVSTTGTAVIASTTSVSSAINAGGGVNVTATNGGVTGSIQSGGAVAVNAAGAVSAAVSTTGSANLVSTSGGVSSTISAGGSVAVAAPGPVTSTISSGGSIALTSNTPINVQVTGGAVSINAPGGQVTGVFGEIATDQGGSFVVNDQSVIGSGETDARQVIVDQFLTPAGGSVGPTGELRLPPGLALALFASQGQASARPVIVHSVDDLGEALRQGYTAIIIDLAENGLDPANEELEQVAAS